MCQVIRSKISSWERVCLYSSLMGFYGAAFGNLPGYWRYREFSQNNIPQRGETYYGAATFYSNLHMFAKDGRLYMGLR